MQCRSSGCLMFPKERNVQAKKLLVLFAAATSACLAQIQAGRIVGTVTDPNRGLVPAAKVNITDLGTNQAHSLSTNGSGEFVLTPANPGFYRIEVMAPGFG